MWNRWKTFVREVRAEVKKVTWPKRNEVYGTTMVVIVTCIIFGVYLWFVDVVMSRVITWLYAAFG
jgi:preprotein translocase subunit SecE